MAKRRGGTAGGRCVINTFVQFRERKTKGAKKITWAMARRRGGTAGGRCADSESDSEKGSFDAECVSSSLFCARTASAGAWRGSPLSDDEGR